MQARTPARREVSFFQHFSSTNFTEISLSAAACTGKRWGGNRLSINLLPTRPTTQPSIPAAFASSARIGSRRLLSAPSFCHLGNRTNERKSGFGPVWGASMLQQGDIFTEGTKRARSQMSKEEMHDTILMSSLASAHPPRVFARAIKAMILQTELLRGAARAAMQQEIRGVLDTAQTERDRKCARLTSSADAANCLEPAVGAASSSLCFETAPYAGNVPARDQSNDAGEPETSAEPFEPADFVRVSFSGIFAPSCNSCGWLAGQCACVILQE